MKFAVSEISERYLNFSHAQMAEALGIHPDSLEEMERNNEGPPRFRASPRRWAYPAEGYRRWRDKRLTETAA